MIAYAVKTDYCVPLTERQWAQLQKLDFFDLHGKLVQRGVVRNTLEYEGHFGQNLYFSLYVDENGETSLGTVIPYLISILGDT